MVSPSVRVLRPPKGIVMNYKIDRKREYYFNRKLVTVFFVNISRNVAEWPVTGRFFDPANYMITGFNFELLNNKQNKLESHPAE